MTLPPVASTQRVSRGARWNVARGYVAAGAIVALTTAVGLALRSRLETIDIAMLFLLAVVVVATRYARGPAVLASLLGILAFDFAFVPPYYTLAVRDSSFVLTFGVMLTVALLMSRLTARIREQAESARVREVHARALHAFDQALAGAASRADLTTEACRTIDRMAGVEAAIVEADADGQLRWPARGWLADVDAHVVAGIALDRGEPAGWGTAHAAEAEVLALPLRAGSRTLGVAVLRRDPPDRELDAASWPAVQALVSQTAAALHRADLAAAHEKAVIEMRAERLRTALLSSLSHDLRTPLGVIEGAAGSLLHDAAAVSGDTRKELAETVLEEARRMTRLVTNLLDMVRVETGTLEVRKSWQPLEEALGVALVRLDERLEGYPVESRLDPTLPLVPIDELLIEQVFLNLLDNVVRHAPSGTRIVISAWVEQSNVVVEVADSGPGIPPGQEEAIFARFRQGPSSTLARSGGAGLGLTICRGIVTAHGGRMWVEPRPASAPAQGLVVRFTLPLEGPPMSAVPEADSEA